MTDKKVEISLDKAMNTRLEDYAERKDTSVSSVIKESVVEKLDRCDAKEVLTAACDEGEERLRALFVSM